MYKVVVGTSVVGSFYTLEDAIRQMILSVKEEVDKGSITHFWLNETIWIEKDDNYLMGFHEARDKGYKLGVLKDGELVRENDG